MRKLLVSLLIVLFCTSFFGGIGNVYALSATVSANPATPGANALYTVHITTQQALTANTDYIKITFASGFTVPASINNGTIRVNGAVPHSVSVNGLSVYIYPSQNLAAGNITVYIYNSAGIKNPPVGGTYYTITVSTSKETTGYAYSLYIQSAVRNLTVSVNPNSAGSYAAYTISFVPNVALSNSDHIYVTFPSGTTLPSTIHASYITVNGYHCYYVSKINSLKLDIRPPVNVNANTTCVIVINDTFGIKNPTNPGNYTLQLSTNKEPASAVSNTYTIIGSNIKNLTVSLSPNTAGTVATYSIWFTTGPSGALSNGDYIKISFPADTYVPTNSNASYITINGMACSYTTVNERTLTIYLPNGLSIGNNAPCTVVIADRYGIKNPTTPGDYTLNLSTSKDTIPAVSNTYTIIGTSIYNLKVVLEPNVQDATAKCIVSFRTSGNGALTQNSDKIYVQFPSQFDIPDYISPSYVAVNGISASYVSVSQNELEITTPVSIGNNANVSVTISKNAKIKNPSSPGDYIFSVSTSGDVVPENYTVTIRRSTIKSPTVTLSSYAVGDVPQITVTFTSGSAGSLTQNSDKIYIEFPTEFKLPTVIPAGSVSVDNVAARYVSRHANRLDITVPISIPANSKIVVVIGKNAGIKNPQAIGDYALKVYTSKETEPVETNTFTIIALPKTVISVNPPRPDGKNGYYVTAPIITLTASSPVDANPTIYYYIDNGSPKVYTAPFRMIDGVHTLYFYAVDHQGNKEKPQSKKFLVDTKPPVLQIISPKNGAVINTKQCTIKGKTEKDATVTIDGQNVPVEADGSFTFTSQISGQTVFTIVAEDIAGNKTTVKLSVSLDTTPPKLKVSAPYAFEVFHQPIVTVKGQTEKDATVEVNGHKVNVNGENYTFTYTLTLTKEGLNSINVVATDLAGNVSRVSIPVKFIPKTKIVLQVGNKNAIVNGSTVKLEAPPVIVHGRTLVPLRFIAEAFGAKVQWNPVFKLVFISIGDKEIILQVGTPYASVNNRMVKLDAPPKIVNGHTMVPLRFIAEAFGASITWDNTTRSITIVYPK